MVIWDSFLDWNGASGFDNTDIFWHVVFNWEVNLHTGRMKHVPIEFRAHKFFCVSYLNILATVSVWSLINFSNPPKVRAEDRLQRSTHCVHMRVEPSECGVIHKEWFTSGSNKIKSIQSPLFCEMDAAVLELHCVNK